MASDKRLIDSNIMYSILHGSDPNVLTYTWFVHVEIVDNPYQKSYHVDTIIPGKVFFIQLRFGFKVEHQFEYHVF